MYSGGKRERGDYGGGGGEERPTEIRVARRVYVGNLAYQTSWQDLKDHFGQVGAVRHADVLREAGPGSRSKGCGIVEFETPEDAAAAITQLHDSELGGRKIFIREDREDFELRGERRRPAGGGGGGGVDDGHRPRGPTKRSLHGDDHRGGGGGGGEVTITVARRVFVGNLAYQTSWQDLKDHFGQVGAVRHADVLREAGPGSRSKGCGIVEFETPEEAAAAITQLHDSELGGRKIWIREDREDFELRGERGHGGGGSDDGHRGPAKRPYRGEDRGGDAVSVGRRVYVGNLSYETTWAQLKDHFKTAGRVAHADILTDAAGASRGSGIVEFERSAEALHAISMLSNSTLDGRQIHVREDREDPAASQGGASRQMPPARHVSAGGGGGSVVGGTRGGAPGTQVVVHGLPYSYSWQQLKDLGKAAASVLHADIATHPDGSSKGWGFLACATPSDAQAAIQALNGTELEGRVVTAKLDKFVQ